MKWVMRCAPHGVPTLAILIKAVNENSERSHAALSVLEEMGPQAKSAAPALLALHKAIRMEKVEGPEREYSKELRERRLREIENSLRKVDPEAAKKAGLP